MPRQIEHTVMPASKRRFTVGFIVYYLLSAWTGTPTVCLTERCWQPRLRRLDSTTDILTTLSLPGKSARFWLFANRDCELLARPVDRNNNAEALTSFIVQDDCCIVCRTASLPSFAIKACEGLRRCTCFRSVDVLLFGEKRFS